jgi:hypothetical protein
MISWGVKVNDYGNAELDANGEFIKVPGQGVTEEAWAKMAAHAREKGWKKGDYKKLNLPFENLLLGQPREVRERMIQAVEDFTYHLLVDVFNAKDTAALGIEAILKAGSHDLGPKCARIEDPAAWTPEKIAAKAKALTGDKGPAGDFSD